MMADRLRNEVIGEAPVIHPVSIWIEQPLKSFFWYAWKTSLRTRMSVLARKNTRARRWLIVRASQSPISGKNDAACGEIAHTWNFYIAP